MDELEQVIGCIQSKGRALHQSVWELLITQCGCQAPHLAPALRYLDDGLTELANCSAAPNLFVIESDQLFLIAFRRKSLAHQGKPVYQSLQILGVPPPLYALCSHGRWGCSQSLCCVFLFVFSMWVDCEDEQLFTSRPWLRNCKTKNTYEHVLCNVRPLPETEVSALFVLHETTAHAHKMAPRSRQPRSVPENYEIQPRCSITASATRVRQSCRLGRDATDAPVRSE